MKDPTEPYTYSNEFVLNWSPDSEGWVTPIVRLGEKAQVYIGPAKDFDVPKDSTCETVIDALNNIQDLVLKAKAFLVGELNLSERHKDNPVSEENLNPLGIEVFEHENTPGEFSVTFEPEFDQGAIYRVRFTDGQVSDWGFDD